MNETVLNQSIARRRVKPKVGVFKFTSCDGCQLSLLDLEEDLLMLAQSIEIAYFMEATRRDPCGPYDLAIVEGSITTPEQLEEIQQIRAESGFLLVIGACATAGGIQALRNFADVKEFTASVYATPSYIKTLVTSTPISQHVDVDYELRGCPINKRQLLEVITAFLNHKKPTIPNESVCVDCKLEGHVCVMVAKGQACLGQLTHSGCGALCPGFDRGCYGCYGPKERANYESVTRWLLAKGLTSEALLRKYQTYNCDAPENRKIRSVLLEE